MLEYFIGALLIIITILLILLAFRKRIYAQVDALESWKIDVMNRNVASELSKIKDLNLSGETQEKFEKWKSRWERIVAGYLADVEEYLYDAEEAADRFLFPRAKKTLKAIEDVLEKSEQEIEKILEELELLLQAERDSKESVTEINEEVERLNRLLLEERFRFGKADRYFILQLDELKNELISYDDYVESGEYTRAKDHVKKINKKVTDLSGEIDIFPAIYQRCRKELPNDLYELTLGINEMIAEGYRVVPYNFDREIKAHEETLNSCVEALERGEIKEVNEISNEIQERITNIYDQLEQEAVAKNFVESQISQLVSDIKELLTTFEETEKEIENLKTTYFFGDDDMEKLLSLGKQVNHLVNSKDKLLEKLEDEKVTHFNLREDLEEKKETRNKLSDQIKAFIEDVNKLRKDELEAKDELDKLQSNLNEVNRLLQTSNLPGVPDFIWDRIEESRTALIKVEDSFKRQPLDISQVQHVLDRAREAIERAEEEAEIIIDQCYLTEQVIQYANRYRSQYPLLSAELSEAERLFRDYEYELSLEKAARAIEEIEPGALRRIEENQRHRQSV